MSEPLYADQVARQGFSLGFRGFDQREVRAFLGRVAAEIASAHEREARLRERVAELESAPVANAELDEAALEAALGHAATKVIHAAREAAAEIRANAETEAAAKVQEADSILANRRSEAEESTAAIRAEVDAAIAALRADTERRATAILDESRTKAGAMVVDAATERDRVLDDLTTRRDAMIAELDELRPARARLAEAYDAVRRALDATALEIADADASAGAIVARSDTEPEREPAPVAEPEPGAEAIDWSVPDAPLPAPDERRSSALRLLRRKTESGTMPVAPPPEDALEGVRIIRPEPESEPEPAPIVEVASEPEPEAAVADGVEIEETDGGAVDGLFARLRADRAEKVASAEAVLAAVEPEPEPEPEVSPEPELEVSPDLALLVARDEAVADAERGLVRSMKRALADEQNEVLDALRRLRGAPSIAALLPDVAVHDARYDAVLSGGAAEAAKAGGAVGGGASGDGRKVAAELGHNLGADIRIRIERAIDEASGDVETLAEAISSTYREWKTARVERLARDAITAAFASGVYAATSGELRWIIDPAEGGCPDCDDNVLAGPTAKGSPFPTGVLHPPAHVGCRCVAVTAS